MRSCSDASCSQSWHKKINKKITRPHLSRRNENARGPKNDSDRPLHWLHCSRNHRRSPCFERIAVQCPLGGCRSRMRRDGDLGRSSVRLIWSGYLGDGCRRRRHRRHGACHISAPRPKGARRRTPCDDGDLFAAAARRELRGPWLLLTGSASTRYLYTDAHCSPGGQRAFVAAG